MWNEYTINTVEGNPMVALLILIGIIITPIVIYLIGSEVKDYVANLHTRSN